MDHWLSSLGIIAQIWGPAKGQLAPSHRLLTHSLAGHVHPASPPPPPPPRPTITSFISCCDITPPLPGPPAGNEHCRRSSGGKCGWTRTHLCPPTQQPVCPSLPPGPPPHSVVKVGRGSQCRRVKVFQFLLTEARLATSCVLTACQTFGSLFSECTQFVASHVFKAGCHF